MNTRHKLLLIGQSCFALILTFCLTIESNGQDNQADAGRLTNAIDVLADKMVKYLTSDADDPNIAIGSFTGVPPQLSATSGAVIKKHLTDKLTAANINVSRRARLFCSGEYILSDDSDVFITCKIRKGSETLKEFDEKIPSINNLEDIAALIGPQGEISVNSLSQRNEDVQNAIDDPQPVLESSSTASSTGSTPPAGTGTTPPAGTGTTPPAGTGATPPAGTGTTPPAGTGTTPPAGTPPAGTGTTPPAGTLVAGGGGAKTVLKASTESPFGIEIYVKTPDGKYVPRSMTIDEGLSFVDLVSAEVYAIKIINRSGRHAGVTLTIDGLNLFTFSEVGPYRQLGKVLIPPGEHLIKGWHINNQFSDAFLVVDYGESEAVKGKSAEAKLVHDESVGTITAAFCTAYPPGVDISQFERVKPRGAFGTARGPTFEQRYRELPMQFGAIRTILSVRYNRPLPLP